MFWLHCGANSTTAFHPPSCVFCLLKCCLCCPQGELASVKNVITNIGTFNLTRTYICNLKHDEKKGPEPACLLALIRFGTSLPRGNMYPTTKRIICPLYYISQYRIWYLNSSIIKPIYNIKTITGVLNILTVLCAKKLLGHASCLYTPYNTLEWFPTTNIWWCTSPTKTNLLIFFGVPSNKVQYIYI